MINRKNKKAAFLLLTTVLAAACSQACSVTRHNAVPPGLETRAEISGFTGAIRYYPRDLRDLALFEQDFLDSLMREKAYLDTQENHGTLPPAAYLAISGGGDNGAFGAGFLNGWTKSGTRPSFKLVTGVSTGALIAPFAFLGPSYDDKLKELYTTISGRDVASKRTILSALFKDARSDNEPLWNLVKKHITQDMLAAIAAEHAKGRILLIGTANLDALRPVIWNLTKIAASGNPRALELVHTLLIASAAIPGEFPPVMVDVNINDKKYQEMHVDGGAVAQVFIYPPAMRLGELSKEHAIERQRTLYIIRNARLDPEWAQVERRTLPIALRAISSLVEYQGIGDLYRIYTTARRDGVGYNLAFIPETFNTPHTTDFDTAYMRQLFDFGHRLAEEGYPWHKEPPVLFRGN
ncbi:MAG: patatin family protein [Nitrospirae bacterium]|nr:patatin family protein [Nitrospirota bacterium]NTW66450.1 patatin family protein [Nitrospirota bacterium]